MSEEDRVFGSLDAIEDAIDTLTKAGFSFVLMVGISQNRTRVDSSLDPSEKEMMRGWLETGHFDTILGDHLNGS